MVKLFIQENKKAMKKLFFFITVVFIAVMPRVANAQQSQRPGPQPAPENAEKFKLGIAGYTFLKIDIDKTLETFQRVDVHYLSIKDFHLRLNSTVDQIAAFNEKLKVKGVTGYAVGPIYMKSEAEVDLAFEYAKKVGVKLIVGVPNYELLPYVNNKVKEYDIKLAIHLHGPDIAIYPNAEDVWNHVKDLDPRMGMCLDIGHDTRAGKDAVADLKLYQSRVFDMHLKDVTAPTKLGYSLEVGRGIIDFPALVKMLRKVGYTGVVSLEHEKDMDNPFMGIAEDIGYFRCVS